MAGISSNELPNAPACERNREPILLAMLPYLLRACARNEPLEHGGRKECFEIGSGTGQHAAYFSRYFASAKSDIALRQIYWQPSDVRANLVGIARWREHNASAQMLPPLELDLRAPHWQPQRYDFVYTANTLHIVSWPLVLEMCRGVATLLREGGIAFIYGPFNYAGQFTGAGNAQFDRSLRARDPNSGIRDCGDVVDSLRSAAHDRSTAIELLDDIAMPANNRLLVLQKGAAN